MNCLKCGHLLDTGFKCWGCGTQYQLVERTGTAEFINYPLYKDSIIPTNPYYNPEEEYIQWEN